jgi:hypothetical protein
MGARRRLVSYLLINIFVSGLVTGTIIFFYDRAHRANCNPVQPDLTALTSDGGSLNINIVGIVGAGTIASERVVILNNGNQKIMLGGWYLEDSKGTIYKFPQSPELTLFPGASVQVYTKAGTDTLPDLYWGRSDSIWDSGELAVLYDPQNIARAFYRVP